MKVKVKNIEFNPFRNINLVPIDPFTVEKLKSSIDELGLWVGMTARPHPDKPGKYQIPFGHHRLVAIRELGIEEIDIAINEISDFNMVLMMVQENMTQRGVSAEMINGTVREIKEFLDGKLAKYESWDQCQRNDEIISSLLNPPTGKTFNAWWNNLKKEGVGRTTILKFLKDAIPQWRIESALDIINHDDIDIEAVNILETTGRIDGFKKAIRKVNKERKERGEKPIAKEEQKSLAEVVKNTPANGKTGGGNYYKSMEDVIRQEIDGVDEFTNALNAASRKLKTIQEETVKLTANIGELNALLNNLGVTEVRSIASIISISEFTNLLINISTLADYFGITINKSIS